MFYVNPHVFSFAFTCISAIPHTTTGQQIAIINLTAGFCSGLLAKATVYPFDVIRKRLQIQGFNDVRRNFGKVSEYGSILLCKSGDNVVDTRSTIFTL